MKNSTCLVVAFLLFQFTAIAQVRFGVVGGAQLANQSFSFGPESLEGKNRFGYQAGVMADAMLVGNLSFRPQLLYSVKGSKMPDFGLGDLLGALLSGLGELGGTGTTNGPTNLEELNLSVQNTFNYIELPLQLIYSVDAGPGWINLGAGPYVGYALNGKMNVSILGQSESQPIEFGSGEDQAKRLDYGLRLSIGYELPSGLLLNGHFSPGFANLSNSADQKVKNTAFGLSLGFLFGGE